ncbi:Phage integrase family protein [Rubritalea squalenifaciens DSM 18772]|uniref:Phage integrase family protein n=1 Tax=Rubritalea squalenifaciens DSM 18772 TaxID=1123071 RepID=A0A1M6GI71_9BACT|nr:site-specific integrase [Rubritalea squalenifaciens]SHJ09665.1 Phage integrase family protein [Rubritalea squalenifaciens DSM 18772]
MQKIPHQTLQKWQANGKQISDPAPVRRPATQSKTSIAYWKEKIYKPKARGASCPNYSVRFSYKGRREYFSLESPDKELAARKARDIYQDIVDYGWLHALETHRPDLADKQTPDTSTKGKTVGDLIEHASRLSTARPETISTYVRAFRRIVSELEGLSIAKRFYGPAHKKWVASVDQVELSLITPERVSAWRADYISRHSQDASARKSAITTANSCIRNSKALFSRKLLPLLENLIELPTPLPFAELSQLNAGTTRYRSKIDARRILDLADRQLRTSHPNAYLILQLALRCGLRVSEIDHLLWSSIDLDSCTLHVQATAYHQPKSDDSEGAIDLSDSTVTLLAEYKKQSSGIFVIDSESAPTNNDTHRRYRCRKSLDHLRNWLRMQGVTAKKPIHELRKEVGSVIAAEHGIHAASLFLRHSNIQITSSYYVDKKKRIVPEF